MIDRFFRGAREGLAVAMRDAGSGGGCGYLPMNSVGSFSGTGLGTYSTANSSTWTDVTGTSFTVQVNRPTPFFYFVNAACTVPAGVGNGYIRGNVVGFDTTLALWYTGALPADGSVWYFPSIAGRILPGLYTVKLQAATDNGTVSVQVSKGFHQFFDLGN